MEDGENAALSYETPVWLAAATGCADYRQVRSPVIDLTELREFVTARSWEKNAPAELPRLEDALAEIDRGTEILHIDGDTPTNEQWETLGRHFSSVRFLYVSTGWDELWVDDKFPLNWPLELLIIADATSERVTTPAILEGRIRHLVLYYTCSLRFHGPTYDELMDRAKPIDVLSDDEENPPPQPESPTGMQGSSPKGPEAVSDETKDKPNAGSPTTSSTAPTEDRKPSADGIKVFSFPHEWEKWLRKTYGGKTITFSAARPPSAPGPPALRELSILGNDALQQLTHLALADFSLLAALESLTLYSPDPFDLTYVPAAVVLALLPRLRRLRFLALTVGADTHAALFKAYGNDDDIHDSGGGDGGGGGGGGSSSDGSSCGRPYLCKAIPPNVETLRLRGPVSMATDGSLDELAAALGSSSDEEEDVDDVGRSSIGNEGEGGSKEGGGDDDGKKVPGGTGRRRKNHPFLPRLKRLALVMDLPDTPAGRDEKATVEELRVAHAACSRVLDVALRERGVTVERFEDPWVETHVLFRPVDDRWGIMAE